MSPTPEPLEEAGSARPVRMAAVEPESEGTDWGGVGERRFRNSANGWDALVRGGQVWNSLQVERGGNRPAGSPPHQTQAW